MAPTAESRAGTVAPVYFLHAARHSPGYRVVHRTSEGELLTSEVDREGFEQWLLQEHDPDNERGVLRGEITLNHPLLRDGLRLVDMPGTGGKGLSSAVAAETHAYLSGTPLTAVLVNQGSRVMSTLVEVVDELRENQCDVSIAALVVNEHVQDNLAPDKLDITWKGCATPSGNLWSHSCQQARWACGTPTYTCCTCGRWPAGSPSARNTTGNGRPFSIQSPGMYGTTGSPSAPATAWRR